MRKKLIKLKKGFTIIELIIVIIIISIMTYMSTLFLSPTKYKKEYLITTISNCSFIYKQSNDLLKCYYDKNRNGILDNNEINNGTNIILNNKKEKQEYYYIKSLNLQDGKYYKIYKKNYIFNYDTNTKNITKLISIINI